MLYHNNFLYDILKKLYSRQLKSAVSIEPYRLAKVQLGTDFLGCIEKLVGAGLRAVVPY